MSIGLLEHARTLVHRRSTMTASLDAALRAFILSRAAAGRAATTQGWYRQKLVPFLAFLASVNVTDWDQLQSTHLRDYMLHLAAVGHNPGGIHGHARAARAFLHWATEEELVDPRIVARLKMPKVPKTMVRGFDPNEVDALLAAARHTLLPDRDAAIVLLLLDSGLRASELCGLRLEDLGVDRILVRGKGAKERWVPFSRLTARAVRAYLKVRGQSANDGLFVSRTGEPLETNALRQLMMRLGKLSGVPNVHPHRWRHTFALEWLRDGGHEFELQDILGHETLMMTKRYTHMLGDDLVRAHIQHSPVERMRRRK